MVRRSRGIGVRGGEFGNFLCNAKRQKHPYLKRGPEAPWYVAGRPEEMAEAPRGVTGASYEKALSPPMSATCPRTAS